MKFAVFFLAMTGACALRLPTTRTQRRDVLATLAGSSAAIALSGVPPAFAVGFKGPLDGVTKKAAFPRPSGRLFDEDDRATPLEKLQKAREQLKEAAGLLDEQQWDQLRALLASQPLASVRENTKTGPARASPARETYLAAVLELESFTYKQQTRTSFSALTDKKGGCVNTRNPRDGLKSCFIDIAEPAAALTRAEDSLDTILKLPL